jgi:preprotein translocase subunit YajC
MPGFDWPTILMIGGVVVLFYFMLIRPQQKRAKEQQEMMSSLQPGDRVMTISGIVGTVRYLGEKQAIIEISPGVEMTVVKGALSNQRVEDEFEYAEDGSALEPDGDLSDIPAATDDSGEPDGDASTTDNK